MNSEIKEGTSANENKSAEMENAQAPAAGTSEDAKENEDTGVSRGNDKAEAHGPSKSACEKNISIEEVTVGEEVVDVKAKVADKDLPKEQSHETFGHEVGEIAKSIKEVTVGAEVDVKEKVTDKDLPKEQSQESSGRGVAEKSVKEVAVRAETDDNYLQDQARGDGLKAVDTMDASTQVDIMAWMPWDLAKLRSPATFFRKFAEYTEETLAELRDMNRLLNDTLDSMYRKVDQQRSQTHGSCNIVVPPETPEEEENFDFDALPN